MSPPDATSRPLRVLRVYHSAVVSAWRRGRARALADHGVTTTTITAKAWNEGGDTVTLSGEPGERAVGAATIGTHPFRFFYNPVPIWRTLRRGDFDVLDVHEEPAALATFEVLTLARWAGVDVPVTLYSAQNLLKRYPWPFRWFERRALRRATAIHTCNDEVADVLRIKGFTGEVANLGLGTDTGRFAPDHEAPVRDADVEDRPFQVGYVGRIQEFKGIFTLLGAVGTLDDVELTYVGGGPDVGRLGEAIESRGLTGRVRVRGFVDFDALPDLYRSFDVVVAPSHEEPNVKEQFGRVVVEAMASGVPVIVSDCGALAEVAGGAGIVVPQRDGIRLAEAIARVRDDPDLRAELRTSGLGRATHFTWSAVARRQAALYDRCAGRMEPG